MKIDYKKYFISEVYLRIYMLIAILLLCSSLLIQQMRMALREFNPSQTTKLYLKGFINNPKSFLLSARLHIKNGKYEQALIDLELSKGLYEINKLRYDEIQDEIIKIKEILKEKELIQEKKL